MKKKTMYLLFLLILSIYTLNINVQSAEENDYRPSSLELTPHNPIEITSDSDFAIFPGTGTAEDPYLIEGYNITTTSTNGIYIYGTTKYFIVCNCYVDAERYGIFISNVADGTSTVISNTCSNNSYYGIWLRSSGSSTVSNNTCRNNNGYGILLFYSNSSTIVNNNCNNNYAGIWLEDSNYSTVVNNTCNYNDFGILLKVSGSATVANNTCNSNSYGIRFGNSDYSTVANNTCNSNGYGGIALSYSDSLTVANNTCNNNDCGISLRYSDFCVVTYNLLQENVGYGIRLYSSSDDNFIHHNIFVDNNLGGYSQARDDCANNYWYDPETLEVNYWSDWLGIGSYYIDGEAYSIDLYPLGEPVVAEYPQIVLLTLLLSIVPLLLTKIISKKTKK